MQSSLTKVLETSWTIVDGRRASVPELVVVPARSGDLVEAPGRFRTSNELDCVRKKTLYEVRTVVPPVAAMFWKAMFISSVVRPLRPTQ